ncbi:hypothetical protein SODALDRAFT_292627 [Sodiomyces alkalinus F11]|uniref:SMP-LTD domain-containing protein n=1 Tax=Sodiomyces alkalinus (strain CBS 110278 / VKM F-3762 / F11) TaxID=1314773 RepID=A0A3N2Q4Z7_SODAK|nr:hypothetical protein SODALDRAFT_292627 [Sodiomyces alkalinus F11]ROT41695.1 hypothetical protein SODALDRAFT_292627 [Sodiomyces alkalinus F11]
MGSWAVFLFAYLLGGLTFIPLALLAFLAHAHFSLPYREHSGGTETHDEYSESIVQPGDDLAPLEDARSTGALKEEAGSLRSRSTQESEVAAGYFAVCREYVPMGINAKPIERATPVGSTTVAAPSQSVYQTMYRSIFDRKQPQGPLDNKNAISQRPKNAGNVFYVVLRHGHLMLFDDEEQLEVRHVVSLAHHDISIYSGGDITPEGELFIKKNALCLSRRQDGTDTGPDGQLSKPFYLFSEDSSAKEDFYFALIRNQEQYFDVDKTTPKPRQFEVKNIISLVQRLHSSEDQVPTRWLNAMIGRVFLALYRTADLEHFIREKLTKKISRVKRPSFLTNIVIRKIDTGDSAPILLNPRHKELSVEGECAMEGDVKYTGNFRLEVAATARLDLGTRFKAREVNLVLAVVLRKLEGHVIFKIKPPPSNRIWFSFQTMPKMEMTIEPIVSSRQITYTLILRQIENRIKEVIAETLVQPFWDDIPFSNTEHKKWRGGIWEGDDAVVTSSRIEATIAQGGDVDAVDRLERSGEAGEVQAELRPIEKSISEPLADNAAPTGLLGRKLAKKSSASTLTGTTTGADTQTSGPSASLPRTLRPGSMSSPSDPVIRTDPTHADVFKPSSSPPDHASSMMAALSAWSQPASAVDTPLDSPARPASVSQGPSQSFRSTSSSQETADSEKEVEGTTVASNRRNTASSTDSAFQDDGTNTSAPPSPSLRHSLRSNTGSIKSNASAITRGLFARRETTGDSQSSGQSNSDSSHKRTTLSAMASAATQARQWGWNALQRQKEGRIGSFGESSPPPPLDLSKPMGRGQPLPPPGTPLPKPDKNSKVTTIPVPPKHKPVPPSPSPSQAPERWQETQLCEENESGDGKAERKPVPTPPLPARRLRDRGGGGGGDERGNGNDVLIIAAPVGSEPSTPMEEEVLRGYEESGHGQPWAEDRAGVDPSSLDSSLTRRLASLEGNEANAWADSVRSDKDSPGLGKEESSIQARPARQGAQEADDDEDFSGWFDNGELEMEEEEKLEEQGSQMGNVKR